MHKLKPNIRVFVVKNISELLAEIRAFVAKKIERN